MTEKIKPTKYYSIRQLVLLIPWVNNAPTMKRIIKKDIDENNNKTFNTLAIKRGKQTRYFVKGENIIKYLKEEEDRKKIKK